MKDDLKIRFYEEIIRKHGQDVIDPNRLIWKVISETIDNQILHDEFEIRKIINIKCGAVLPELG